MVNPNAGPLTPETKCFQGCGRKATRVGIVSVRPSSSERTTVFTVVERNMCEECGEFFDAQIVEQNTRAILAEGK